MPAKQVSPAVWKVSATKGSGKAIETVPKPKHRTPRLSAAKPAKLAVAITEPKVCPTVDSVASNSAAARPVSSPPACDAVCSTPGATSLSPAVFKHATNEATPRSDEHPAKHATNESTPRGDEHPAKAGGGTGKDIAKVDRVAGRAVHGQGGGSEGLYGASEYLAQQRRWSARERKVTGTLHVLPPGAEVLEVSFGWPRDW